MASVTIKVTAGELMAANKAFAKLMTADMSLNSAFNVMRLINQLKGDMETALATNNKVFEKYGKSSSTGDLSIPPENIAKAMPKLEEVAKIECEVTFDLVTLPGNIVADVATLMALEKFIIVELN